MSCNHLLIELAASSTVPCSLATAASIRLPEEIADVTLATETIFLMEVDDIAEKERRDQDLLHVLERRHLLQEHIQGHLAAGEVAVAPLSVGHQGVLVPFAGRRRIDPQQLQPGEGTGGDGKGVLGQLGCKVIDQPREIVVSRRIDFIESVEEEVETTPFERGWTDVDTATGHLRGLGPCGESAERAETLVDGDIGQTDEESGPRPPASRRERSEELTLPGAGLADDDRPQPVEHVRLGGIGIYLATRFEAEGDECEVFGIVGVMAITKTVGDIPRVGFQEPCGCDPRGRRNVLAEHRRQRRREILVVLDRPDVDVRATHEDGASCPGDRAPVARPAP